MKRNQAKLKTMITGNVKQFMKDNRGGHTIEIIAGIAVAVILIGALLFATGIGQDIINSVIESLTGLRDQIPSFTE